MTVTSISQIESAVHFFVNAILICLLFPNYLNITIVSSDVHYGFSLNLDHSCSASGQKSLVDNNINNIIEWCLSCKLLPYSVAQEVWLFFFMIIKILPCILSWATKFSEENVHDLFFYLQIFHMAPALDFPSQKLVACLRTTCSACLILHDSITPVLWGQQYIFSSFGHFHILFLRSKYVPEHCMSKKEAKFCMHTKQHLKLCFIYFNPFIWNWKYNILNGLVASIKHQDSPRMLFHVDW